MTKKKNMRRKKKQEKKERKKRTGKTRYNERKKIQLKRRGRG